MTADEGPADWTDAPITSDDVARAREEWPEGRVEFVVRGVPMPEGSLRAIPTPQGVRMLHPAAMLAWRQLVAVEAEYAAANRVHAFPLEGPLGLDVEFRFRMPPSRKAKVRREGWAYLDKRPDLDKLVRTIGDALTASGIIRDDAQIAQTLSMKCETLEEWVGARVVVRQLPPGVRRSL